jgi:hypothetical protein
METVSSTPNGAPDASTVKINVTGSIPAPIDLRG